MDPAGRRDFLLLGRLQPYKNIDVVLEAWQRHVDGGAWRGDELVLIGDGPLPPVPARIRSVASGKDRYSARRTVAAAKGSIAHYRRGSQSGVQVLSMQLGVMPIVSTVGGLSEYQPPGNPPIGIDEPTAGREGRPSTTWPIRLLRHCSEPLQHATIRSDSPSTAPSMACGRCSPRC